MSNAGKKYDEKLKIYYYSVIRPLSKDEYESLKQSIKSHGVNVPVEYDEEGAVLDGYHRVKICHELNIKKWPSLIRTGLSEEQKIKLARTLNYNRRHLTRDEKQQEALALRKEGWTQAEISKALGISRSRISEWFSEFGDPYEEIIKEKKQQAIKLSEEGWTHEKIAEEIDIPRRSITHWISLGQNVDSDNLAQKDLLENIPEELPDQANFGIPIFSSSPKTVEKMKEIQEAAASGNEHARKAAATIQKGEANIDKLHRKFKKASEQDEKRSSQEEAEICSPNIEIKLGDFRQELQYLEDQSVDLVFTDPPYHEKYLPLWESLAVESRRILKPGGFLLAYSGQNHLFQVFQLLGEHLFYYWVSAVEHTHGQLRFWHKKAWNSWKPILIFGASEQSTAMNWFVDLYSKGDKETKHYHDWAQPLEQAKYFIEHFCPPQGFVVDPMCGSGTISLAAYQVGRKSLGIDIDQESINTARKRIREFLEKELIVDHK